MNELLENAAGRASRYLADIQERPVQPSPEAVARLDVLREPLPDGPTEAADVLALLDEICSPATTAMAGPRFFGFVIGGSLPVALAANWLATAWDQNAAFDSSAPAAALLEAVALGWMRDLFGLPEGCAGRSSPARRWPTSARSPRPGTRCWQARTGTSRPMACSAHRRSRW